MAFIRKRDTEAGSTSTALVKAYRDRNGHPRQRILANLHGEATLLDALAKLVAQRADLRKEKEDLDRGAANVNQAYEIAMKPVLYGHQYSPSERLEIDRLLKEKEQLLKYRAQVEATLATIERDGAIIKKHCSPTQGEIEAAVRAYNSRYRHCAAVMPAIDPSRSLGDKICCDAKAQNDASVG
jgi:hypothetical protein